MTDRNQDRFISIVERSATLILIAIDDAAKSVQRKRFARLADAHNRVADRVHIGKFVLDPDDQFLIALSDVADRKAEVGPGQGFGDL